MAYTASSSAIEALLQVSRMAPHYTSINESLTGIYHSPQITLQTTALSSLSSIPSPFARH